MHLCENLLTEIFLKLPVLTLLRFRAVCKSWRSIIDSPYFISKHSELFNKNSTKNQLLLVHKVKYNKWRGLEIGVVDEFTFNKINKCGFLSNYCKIRDIFNGFILFQEFRAPYYEFTRFPVLKLWNPSARKHQILRPCPLKLHGDGVDNFALGFDSSSKDYKVVAFGGYDNGVDNVKIAVYSFNNRRWKIKDVGVNNLVSSFSIRLHHRYFCQGAAHWINGDIVVEYDGSFEHRHMSSFDFGVEEFRRVPLPGWKMFKCLFDFGKSLAVFGISAESSKIWIMREDVGEVVSEKPWVRCFKGGSSLDALKFFIGNRNARITYDEYSGVFFLLSWRDFPVRLMSYDITSQKIETIRRNYGYRICCADAYVESWVTCSASILQNVD